ncbi:RHO1 GDP-GTP exchange protein 2 [Umbelopsis sp. WA50703]
MAADGSQYPQPPPHQHPLNRIPSSPHYTSQPQVPNQNVTRSPSQQQVIGRAARQSYARQKLPMRVQSLASYANNESVGRLPQHGMPSYQRSSVASYGIPNSPPPRYELISRPQVPTLSAPPPPRHSSYGVVASASASSSSSTSSSAHYMAGPHMASSSSMRGRPHAKPLPRVQSQTSRVNQQSNVSSQSSTVNAKPPAINQPAVNMQSTVNGFGPQVNQASVSSQPQPTIPQPPVLVQPPSPARQHARLPARTSSIPMRQDDEEFNFRGRPSSTLVQVQSAPDDAYSPDGDEVSFAAQQPEFMALGHGIGAIEKPLPKVSKSESTAQADRHIELEVEKLAVGLQNKQKPRAHARSSSVGITLHNNDDTDKDSPVSPQPKNFGERSKSFSYGTGENLATEAKQKQRHQKRSLEQRSKQPLVYGALLSKVAMEMQKRVVVGERLKDNIQYSNVFDGKEAVDKLAFVLRTSDRTLALLVGRALYAQKFFHDVNYEHRLRDSNQELYQYREHLQLPYADQEEESDRPPESPFPDDETVALPLSAEPIDHQDVAYPNESVPMEVTESVSQQERERQENIFELVYTERDFVRNLDYLQKFWIEPLITTDIIPEERRELFVQEVFWNVRDIYNVNIGLCESLLDRQRESHIVEQVGDILLQHVSNFEPFVVYGAHQIVAKHMFEQEKTRNIRFAEFVHETERKPESRKLELNGYLTKPTTRLGRYNLLLREILKHTPEGNSDREVLPWVMDIIKDFLTRVNSETGKAENRFNLQQISERLSYKNPSDGIDLRLLDSDRQLVMKGKLKRKGSGSESSEVQVFLFDHYLVFAKIKYMPTGEYYKVYRRPIPLELLQSSIPDSTTHKRASSILPYSRSAMSGNSIYSLKSSASEINLNNGSQSKTGGHAITFVHLGRKGSPPFTLYVPTMTQRRTWLDKISRQKETLTAKQRVFEMVTLSERQFISTNRVHHSALYDKQLVLAADHGVYVGSSKEGSTLTRILALEKATQIEILEEFRLMFVLGDKTLWSFPLEALSTNDPAMRRGKKISANVPFFHVGSCLNKILICVVRSNALSATTIRTLEPSSVADSKKSKSAFSRLVRGNADSLKIYKDLYLPSEASSINLLKTKMSLLDPEDENLQFVFGRQDVKPLAIYRIQFAEYLICYNEFAFYVDQKGRRKRTDWRIDWEGTPESFALHYPYILAFEPAFIEVRNIETGAMEQVIAGNNIRCVTNNSKEDGVIHGVMDDPKTESFQFLFQLKPIPR